MLAHPVSFHALPGLLTLSALLLASADASAQSGEPISWFVADLRGSIAPFGQNQVLAVSRGFDQTLTPETGLGLEAGAHVYVYRWRVITFGVGASFHTSVCGSECQGYGPQPERSYPSQEVHGCCAPDFLELRRSQRMELPQWRTRHVTAVIVRSQRRRTRSATQ